MHFPRCFNEYQKDAILTLTQSPNYFYQILFKENAVLLYGVKLEGLRVPCQIEMQTEILSLLVVWAFIIPKTKSNKNYSEQIPSCFSI